MKRIVLATVFILALVTLYWLGRWRWPEFPRLDVGTVGGIVIGVIVAQELLRRKGA